MLKLFLGLTGPKQQVSDHAGERKTTVAMVKADLNWQSSDLGSFPLTSLSDLVDCIKANASFGITDIFIMLVLFSPYSSPLISKNEDKYSHS